MQDSIIYKLKALQSIEPDEAWQSEKKRRLMERFSVFGIKNDIFLNAQDIYAEKTKFNIRQLIPSSMTVSFTSILLVLTGGVLTVGASQSSLPGDTLYPVKKVSEQVALAVASEQDKPQIEIKQAGKRLEELALVSHKASDAQQHQKVEQLVSEFQQKVSNANDHLARLNDKGKTNDSMKVKVANVAKVINEQSEKYTDVLKKTSDNLPDTIKEKVALQVADATKMTEKTNMAALMVMVESNGGQDDEMTAKVQATITKVEVKMSEAAAAAAQSAATTPTAVAGATINPVTQVTTSIPKGNATCTSQAQDSMDAQQALIIAEEAQKELQLAKENLKNNNLLDTLKNVVTVSDITDKVNATETMGSVPALSESMNATTTTENAD